MKILLNEKVLTMQQWLDLNENETSPTNEKPRADVDSTETNTDLSKEIDVILDKLKDLEDGLNEELLGYFENLLDGLHEAKDEGLSLKKIKDFMITAPKIRKMQQKANQMRLNQIDLEFAKANASGDRAKQIGTKTDGLSNNIKELESDIDTFAKDHGMAYSQRVKNMTRIKGKMQVLKKKTGMSDNPKQKSSLKNRMLGLKSSYEEEVEAAKVLQDDAPDKQVQYDSLVKSLKADGYVKGEGDNQKAVQKPNGDTEYWHLPAKEAPKPAKTEPAKTEPASSEPATSEPASSNNTETPVVKNNDGDPVEPAKTGGEETEEEKKKREEEEKLKAQGAN